MLISNGFVMPGGACGAAGGQLYRGARAVAAQRRSATQTPRRLGRPEPDRYCSLLFCGLSPVKDAVLRLALILAPLPRQHVRTDSTRRGRLVPTASYQCMSK